MRLFVKSLNGKEIKWFKGFPNGSINNWEELETKFTQRWGEKRDHGYSLTEFNAIMKNSNENMNDFIKRFNKLYKSLPTEMKPPPVGARDVFVGAFESDFSFTLRERRSPTLEKIQTDALEIEANITAVGKTQEKQSVQEKGKAKEESSQDQRIDDMTKVVKNLSNKLVKMELESKKPAQQNSGVFNPQFRKQPLQILQRERRDQDQI